MSNPSFSNGSYYHIYNRGVEKRNIYMDDCDYYRFLETLNFYHKIPAPMKLSDFRRGATRLKKIENQTKLVTIFCYCLMPNHFHLLIRQEVDGGITLFLRKLSDSFTRYFNTRYKRVGSLFQGTFKAKLIESDEYLLHLSKYIHKNSFPLEMWESKAYPYSSYSYYLFKEEHSFCDIDFILSYFAKENSSLDYQSFVEEQEIENPDLSRLLIDPDEC
ncbi:MAG: transposase [Candidatus Daviesbacteria bacterium]|nr:transposase [Candidatus Daviesbacteria bacterium]